MKQLPVAIIGGGPVGLAALAQLLERGQDAILIEAGATIGANVLAWGHVRMFSPWEFNIDAACARRLEATGWRPPPADELPTGAELVERYLRPLADLPEMRARIRSGVRVMAVSRRQHDKVKDSGRESTPFQLQIRAEDGTESVIEARAVIDASGSWHNPNPLGANGLPALGERALRQRIAYGIPDVLDHERRRFAGKRVMVVGSGHSAINALLDLIRLRQDYAETEIVWALRGGNLQKVYGGGENDALEARGQLGLRMKATVEAGALEILAPFQIDGVEALDDGLRVRGKLNGEAASITTDELIVCTGTRPDLNMLRELRLDLDPAVESSRALAPLIDPNLHSCGTVRPHGEADLRQPEQGFYIVGMKSYGRAPTFLMVTGYEQVRSIAAALAGDWQAARDVQLVLPETGVCVTEFAAADGCCAVDDICCAPANIAIGEIPLVSIGDKLV